MSVLLQIVGLLVVTAGCTIGAWLVYVPAGFLVGGVVGGVSLVLVGAFMEAGAAPVESEGG